MNPYRAFLTTILLLNAVAVSAREADGKHDITTLYGDWKVEAQSHRPMYFQLNKKSFTRITGKLDSKTCENPEYLFLEKSLAERFREFLGKQGEERRAIDKNSSYAMYLESPEKISLFTLKCGKGTDKIGMVFAVHDRNHIAITERHGGLLPLVRAKETDLKALEQEQSLEGLIKTAQTDPETFSRSKAVRLIGERYPASKEAVEPMISVLFKDKNPGVRQMAADALGKHPTPNEAAASALRTALKRDENADVRFSAARALGKMAKDTETLVAILNSNEDTFVKRGAIYGLAQSGAKKESIAPALFAFMRKNAPVKLNQDKIPPSLYGLMRQDAINDMQVYAAIALYDIGEREQEVLSVLREAAKHGPYQQLRDDAAARLKH